MNGAKIFTTHIPTLGKYFTLFLYKFLTYYTILIRYVGVFQFMIPMLMIKDLELIKQITIKDFDQMMNRRQIVTEEMEPIFGKNLVSLQGH